MQIDRKSMVGLAKEKGISLEVWDFERFVEDDGSITYRVEVRAHLEDRFVSSIGLCNTLEVEEGREHHDAAATAETRAKNRAVAELLDIDLEDISDEPITKKQIRQIHALIKSWDCEDEYRDYIFKKFGKTSTKELTEKEAEDVVRWIKASSLDRVS